MSNTENSSSIRKLVDEWKQMARSLPDGSESAVPPTRTTLAEDGDDDEVRQHLIEMLTVAVQLEFSTIPPYLCALWSIKDELHPVAKSIREIVQEEMLHMGLACNMLAAVGGKPRLAQWAPDYPTPLPGEVHKGLTVSLQGLNRESLLDFIRIETPDQLAPNVPHEPGDPDWSGSETIGEFYQTILEAFQCYRQPLILDCQVTASLVWRLITSVKDVEWAIQIITSQGEGAQLEDGMKRKPKEEKIPSPRDSSKDDYAHYYRFLEVWKEKKLVLDSTHGGEDHYRWQAGYSLPEVCPMGKVPKDGFTESLDSNVLQLLTDFDRTYSEMLRLLEQSWTPGGQGNLVHAISRMFDLEQYAKPLMQIKIREGKTETYGPQFRYRADTDNPT